MTSAGNRPLAKRLYLYLLGIIALLAGVHLLSQHLNLNVYHELNGPVFEISNRVDFDDEASLPTWVSQVTLLAIGLSALFLALLQTSRAAKRIWILIGVIGVLLSVDEVAAIHELGLQIIHLALFKQAPPTLTDNAWLILLPFVLIAGSLLLWQLIKHVPRKTIFILTTGAVTFMLGAVFIDILTTSNGANTFYEKGVLVAVEETLEMIGSATVLYAILDFIGTTYGDRVKLARKRLKG